MGAIERKSWRVLAAAAGALALAGCTSTGMTGGASTIGAFADSSPRGGDRQMSAAIVEAMAGGLIGRSADPAVDQRDRQRALEAEYRALEHTPVGQPVGWGGSRVRGEVTAAAPYRVGSQNCRQYVHRVFVGGQAQEIRGAACRNVDGSWTPLA